MVPDPKGVYGVRGNHTLHTLHVLETRRLGGSTLPRSLMSARRRFSLAAAKPFRSGTVSMSHTMTWGMSSVSVPQCDIPLCQFFAPVTRPEGYNGMSSEKFVPTEDIGRVSSPPSCCESALTRRVPNRLLVAGSKSRGRPPPSSRTEIKIACLSGCRRACTQIEPPEIGRAHV